MSKWCETCYRNNMSDGWKSCDDDCPVFGKHFEELAKFNIRAEELLKACIKLLNKQNESPYVLNLLDELIFYDDCECDGNCLLEDIENLLEYGE